MVCIQHLYVCETLFRAWINRCMIVYVRTVHMTFAMHNFNAIVLSLSLFLDRLPSIHVRRRKILVSSLLFLFERPTIDSYNAIPFAHLSFVHVFRHSALHTR